MDIVLPLEGIHLEILQKQQFLTGQLPKYFALFNYGTYNGCKLFFTWLRGKRLVVVLFRRATIRISVICNKRSKYHRGQRVRDRNNLSRAVVGVY